MGSPVSSKSIPRPEGVSRLTDGEARENRTPSVYFFLIFI